MVIAGGIGRETSRNGPRGASPWRRGAPGPPGAPVSRRPPPDVQCGDRDHEAAATARRTAAGGPAGGNDCAHAGAVEMRFAPLALLAVLLAGCSGQGAGSSGRGPQGLPGLSSARNVGRGPRFRPDATGALTARAEPVDRMRCRRPGPVAAAVHVEIFAAGHVVRIPAGIGFAAPLSRHGAYVSGGRCAYPLRTVEPTGVVLMEAGRAVTLGRLFDVWGQRLTRRAVAGFSAPGGAGVSVRQRLALAPGPVPRPARTPRADHHRGRPAGGPPPPLHVPRSAVAGLTAPVSACRSAARIAWEAWTP
jgi:hypothetical protein